ncbi:MAG: M48 family metallopeptidase [Bdellovibrionales bacterium]|nr:M48 family metallopeptidase [Bdellovibrionales bacterium]
MTLNFITFVILLFWVGSSLFSVLVDGLNLRSAQKPMSKAVQQTFGETLTEEILARTRSYMSAHFWLDTFQTFFFLTCLVAFTFHGGFQIVFQAAQNSAVWIVGAQGEPWIQIVSGVFFLIFLGLLQWSVSLPFQLYTTFKIETDFGFNKMTFQTWVSDLFKGLLVAAVLGLPLLVFILWIFETAQNAWLWAWIVVTIYQIILMILAPAVIMPLFNKFTPLPANDLRTAIEAYAKKEAFPLSEIYTMDGSKRSTKANAFFTGLGKLRRIVLFDNLVAKNSNEELVAILAHEIGHFKKKHILRQLSWSIISSFAMFYLMGMFLELAPQLFPFGILNPNVAISLIAFSVLYGPLGSMSGLVSMWMSRKYEFEADQFSIDTYGKPQALANALKRMGLDHLSNPQPHFLKVMTSYTHPPLPERIAFIEKFT